MCPPFDYTVPCSLHSWEVLGEPFAVALDAHHHKLGLGAFSIGRAVLYKITLFKIRNLELQLNLGQIVLGHLCLDFASQWALYLNEEPILSDPIR